MVWILIWKDFPILANLSGLAIFELYHGWCDIERPDPIFVPFSHDPIFAWQRRKRWGHENKHRKLTPEIEQKIVSLIQQYLSPEQVSDYLKEHHELSLSHKTIYRFIYSDPERHATLKPYLRQGHKHRRKRYGSGARASKIPHRISITERPEIVEKKQRLGDSVTAPCVTLPPASMQSWECDTVIGLDRKSVLVTVVDRTSLFTCCSRVYSRTADVVCRAIIRLLLPHKDKVKTLTFDNGSEFVQHRKIANSLDAQTYFAHPYSSWERGINENTNGLLRQFFPKRTDFKKLTWKQVKNAVDNLNNRPRKTRDYQTPNQIFNNVFVPLI